MTWTPAGKACGVTPELLGLYRWVAECPSVIVKQFEKHLTLDFSPLYKNKIY